MLNQTEYLFSDSFYSLGPVLVVNQNSHATSLDEMEGKIIGIKEGSSSVYNVQHFHSILILPYDNMVMALEDLNNDKIDGVIMDVWPAYAYIQSFYKGKLRVVTSPLIKEGLRLATLRQPEYVPLIDGFNEGLKELKKSGEYDDLLKRWGLFNTEITK